MRDCETMKMSMLRNAKRMHYLEYILFSQNNVDKCKSNYKDIGCKNKIQT